MNTKTINDLQKIDEFSDELFALIDKYEADFSTVVIIGTLDIMKNYVIANAVSRVTVAEQK